MQGERRAWGTGAQSLACVITGPEKPIGLRGAAAKFGNVFFEGECRDLKCLRQRWIDESGAQEIAHREALLDREHADMDQIGGFVGDQVRAKELVVPRVNHEL